MAPDKLIRMANQIARFMSARPEDEAKAGFAAHLNDYWEPRMRQKFHQLISEGAEGFDPLVLSAAPLVRAPAASS